MLPIYARIENNEIVTYPVYTEEVDLNLYPEVEFITCTFEKKPELPKYHKYIETLKLLIHSEHPSIKEVLVTTNTTPLSCDELLTLLITLNGSKTLTADSHVIHTELIAKIVETMTETIQTKLDNFAAERKYGDNRTSPIMAAVSYLYSSDEKFKNDALVCVKVRDDTWKIFNDYINLVSNGVNDIPETFDTINKLLPELKWS